MPILLKSSQAGGTALQHQKYWWDDNGNLAIREDEVATETERFSYDNLDRLVGVSGPYTESFSYDVLGNITSKNGTSYTYGGVQPHAVTGVGNYTQDYDANGNMTARANATGTQTLAWNAENLLSQVDGTGGGYSGTATYVYDGDGKRIKKTEGGSTVVYPGRYYEKNMTTSTVTSYYYLGGKLVALKKGSTLEYVHQDHLSSSSLSSDSSGGQVSLTKFFSFGSTRSSTGTLGTDMKYTGQRLDGTDLYFYNARYYDSSIGRFVSPDDVTPDYTNPQDLNRYSYVQNNPLKYTDPTGHKVVLGEDDGGNLIEVDNNGNVSPNGSQPGLTIVFVVGQSTDDYTLSLTLGVSYAIPGFAFSGEVGVAVTGSNQAAIVASIDVGAANGLGLTGQTPKISYVNTNLLDGDEESASLSMGGGAAFPFGASIDFITDTNLGGGPHYSGWSVSFLDGFDFDIHATTPVRQIVGGFYDNGRFENPFD